MAKKAEAETIRNFLDQLWKQANSMIGVGRKRTSEFADTAKTKLDLFILSTKRDNLYRQLGEYVYTSQGKKRVAAKKSQMLTAILHELREVDLHEKSLKKSIGTGRGRKPRAMKAGAAKAARKGKTGAKRGRPRKSKTAATSPAATSQG